MTKDKGISIKGSKDGVRIFLPEDQTFESILVDLEAYLEKGSSFFKDTIVTLIFTGKELNNLEYSQLVDIIINKTSINCEKIIADINNRQLTIQSTKELQTEFIKGTVRAGQKIHSEKHVVILGDVNPSAEVIAEGNIIVLGHLNGNVQAGFPDKEHAFVAAFSMQPNLLKIGHVIGRSSDEARILKKIKKYAEIAYVHENQIIIEPLDYKTISRLPIDM